MGIGAVAQSALKEERVELPPSYALPPATEGILAEMANAILAEHGPDSSGFKLLDSSFDGLQWRLALIDSAVSSVDIMTYLWYPDHSGRLVLEHAVRAAERGVKVRMVVDDLMLINLDQVIVALEAHPNIEFRIFNPWEGRDLGSRAAEMIAEMERLNVRMHDKLLIADGNAAVVGGRNIGDHYFGISDAYNFHDMDLMGFGHIARQANDMFDSFWNSEWVVSSQNLTTEHDPTFAKEEWQAIQEQNRAAKELQAFARERRDWGSELAPTPISSPANQP